MFPIDPATAKIVIGCLVLVIILISVFYSPAEYAHLKALYKAQCEADDKVYEWKKHAGPLDKLLHRWTTKDVEHYYE